MSCRTGCPTQDHQSWGACARAASLRIGYCRSAAGYDKSKQDRWDAELDRYEAAVDAGINPEGTTLARVHEAEMLSEATGVPYGTPAFEQKVQERILTEAA